MASRPTSQQATCLQEFFNVPDRLDALEFEVAELAAESLLDGHDETDHHDRIPPRYVAKRHVLGQSRGRAIEDPGNEILSMGRRGGFCGIHVDMIGLRTMSLPCIIVRRAVEGGAVREAATPVARGSDEHAFDALLSHPGGHST